MKILAVETSCDETAAAVVNGESKSNKVILLSSKISSSFSLHAKTGGIIPEIAAREQIKYVVPVIEGALTEAKLRWSKDKAPEIDAIAVTIGPGLIGSLLVGIETAKTLSFIWKKPIVPVNHLMGHVYANFVAKKRDKQITFPALCLVVSGGHTDLLVMKGHKNLTWIGGTRDDAAGEAFDKIGRILKLNYPGGPEIEKAAKKGKPRFNLPKPMINSKDYDFSFSGLKTAVLKEIRNNNLDNHLISDMSFAVQKTIIDVLISKTFKAAKQYRVKTVLVSGGVAANQYLRDRFEQKAKESGFSLSIPEKSLCTDNAAMIGAAAFYNYSPIDWKKVIADPELYFDNV